MTSFEQAFAAALPRPEIDADFADKLLDRLMSGRPALLVDLSPAGRIRIHHVGGVMGAVALAVGAAIGWRARSRGGRAA